MEVGDIPSAGNWIKSNTRLAIALVLVAIVAYGAWSFAGSYGTKFGESFVGNYSKFKKSVASYTVIDAILHDYLAQFNANRIGIARFHNSVHDVGNNSLFFISFETIMASNGVSANFEDIANLPATVYAQILPDMIAKRALMSYTKDLKQGPLKELKSKRGTKATLYIPVNDLSNQVIGMITVSWLSENDIPSDADRAVLVKSIQEAASRIGGYYSAVSR